MPIMKRLAAPKFWKIEKKTKKFVVLPTPGPHSTAECIPVAVVLRDMLHAAYTMKEAKEILKNGLVTVDGRMRKDEGFPVGIMDVVSVGQENYRIFPDCHGLNVMAIEKKEAATKLLRIEDKKIMKKGKIQLNFHDGSNMIMDKNDHNTGDVLVFDFENRAVKSVLKFEKGCRALIIKGNNIGTLATVDEIITTKSSMPNQIVVTAGERKFNLPKSYLFVVGKTEPVISVGECK